MYLLGVSLTFKLDFHFNFLKLDENPSKYLFLFTGGTTKKHFDATLGSGNLRETMRLPHWEDIN